MRSDDVDTLGVLISAANGWRTAALAENVELNILTTEINNELVILSWNEAGYWDVRTS